MPKIKTIPAVDPMPAYIMPDRSEPAYLTILEQLQTYRQSMIGKSYFYIRAGEDCNYLCRIVHGGGKVFYHELVDHRKHGISDEDIDESVKQDNGTFTMPDLFPVSPHVEQKLRVLYE